jgi:hypothetical protein
VFVTAGRDNHPPARCYSFTPSGDAASARDSLATIETFSTTTID